jgi:hypothetical protein
MCTSMVHIGQVLQQLEDRAASNSSVTNLNLKRTTEQCTTANLATAYSVTPREESDNPDLHNMLGDTIASDALGHSAVYIATTPAILRDTVPIVLRHTGPPPRGDHLVVQPALAEQLQQDFLRGEQLPEFACYATERAKIPASISALTDEELMLRFASTDTGSIPFERTAEHNGEELSRWLRELLCEFSDIVDNKGVPGKSPYVQVHVDIPPDQKPVRCGRPIINPKARAVLEEHVKSLLTKGVLRPSNSPWSSALFFVPKKDGKLRCTLDVRSINRLVPRLSFGLPRLTECTDNLASAKYISNCDIRDAYWTLPLTEESQDYFAISTHLGQFTSTRLVQGYRNSQALFVHFVHQIVLQGYIGKIAFAFCDDIILWSKDAATHVRDIHLVFARLRFHNLKLNAKKCEFAVRDRVLVQRSYTRSGLPNSC